MELCGPDCARLAAVWGLIIFPVLSCFTISFTDWIGVGWPKFVGFQNYLNILKDPVFYHGLRNNLLVVAVSVFGQIPIGFTLAYILYRKMVRGEAFFTAMIFLPITISAIVVAILWQQIFFSGRPLYGSHAHDQRRSALCAADL
jgi:multiple sugar transport system permease protein/raffinose/stachyose/melibiose transport system permease protein